MANSHKPLENDSSGVPIQPPDNGINNDSNVESAAHKDEVMLDDLETNIDLSIDDLFQTPDVEYLNVSPESSNHKASMESGNYYKCLDDSKNLNCHSSEYQGSGNCGMNNLVTSSPNVVNNSMKRGVVKQKTRLEDLKRKKVSDDSNNVFECQKSDFVVDGSNARNVNSEKDEKKKSKMEKRRVNCRLYRKRKKHYVEDLEDNMRIMHSTIQELNRMISHLTLENATLKSQMGSTSVPSQIPPLPGMNPHHPIRSPWMFGAPPYMVRPEGSQAPHLVIKPIPRKPQAVALPTSREAPAAGAGSQKSAYVPPIMRGGASASGSGEGTEMRRRNDENSVRVTNLSENTREADLLELFCPFGHVSRVYVAIDQNTGMSRGFGFVNFVNREDAERAINKLNGYCYHNLILRVEWAAPRAT
ncbi:bZIP transcription factor 49-like [Solanum stenotomum]|uniref:bZIP transcription factor 49-like n=1 Tax=Solanum stenotomum TaxID=172797 RepID=UPI0020D156F4|nr:bZIP transcription factor 49-like [Solanum stenotomum]